MATDAYDKILEHAHNDLAAEVQPLTEHRRLGRALAEVIRPEFIGPWLRMPNEAFEGLSPLEVIERGELERIWRMVYELESGVPA